MFAGRKVGLLRFDSRKSGAETSVDRRRNTGNGEQRTFVWLRFVAGWKIRGATRCAGTGSQTGAEYFQHRGQKARISRRRYARVGADFVFAGWEVDRVYGARERRGQSVGAVAEWKFEF